MSRSNDMFREMEQHLSQADCGRTYTDEAKRASDIINGHLVAQPDAVQKWVAIRLSDGGSDGTLYATKFEAVEHQLDEYQCFYQCIPPTGTSPAQMEAMIDMHRVMYKQGARMVDPDSPTGGPDWVRPTQLEDLHSQQRRMGILRNSSRWNHG